MTKFWIFFFLVGSLWKGPWWLLLIEKLSEMVSVDVLKGSALILVHLKTFFFDRFHFLVICMAIWDFGLITLRWKLLLGRIRSGVGWEIETSCFGQNWTQLTPWPDPFELGPYFWTVDVLAGGVRSEENVKILDISQTASAPCIWSNFCYRCPFEGLKKKKLIRI